MVARAKSTREAELRFTPSMAQRKRDRQTKPPRWIIDSGTDMTQEQFALYEALISILLCS